MNVFVILFMYALLYHSPSRSLSLWGIAAVLTALLYGMNFIPATMKRQARRRERYRDRERVRRNKVYVCWGGGRKDLKPGTNNKWNL